MIPSSPDAEVHYVSLMDKPTAVVDISPSAESRLVYPVAEIRRFSFRPQNRDWFPPPGLKSAVLVDISLPQCAPDFRIGRNLPPQSTFSPPVEAANFPIG